MRSVLMRLLCLTALTTTAPPASSADGQMMPAECVLKDRGRDVALVICNTEAGDPIWQKAGRAACGTDLLCNAWIWENETDAPDAAPATDSELDQQHTGAAVAIWVNDSQSLIALRRVQQ